jgi:probable HAF family extracellular repeat protein
MSKARAALTHAMAVLVILGLPATNAADAPLEQQNAVEDMNEATHAKRPNQVIVSSHNGDYPNPLTHADNSETRYRLVKLEIPNSEREDPAAINNFGVAVGASFSLPPGHRLRAFLWRRSGAVRFLQTDPLLIQPTEAMGVNDFGQVAGNGHVPGSGALHGFVWTRGRVRDIGELPGGLDQSEAWDISNRGQVVGASQTAAGQEAILWENGNIMSLGDLPGGGTQSIAFAINEFGTVVGAGSRSHDRFRAFVWRKGVMKELKLPLALQASSSVANDVNNRGVIVGGASRAKGPLVWFLHEDKVKELKVLRGFTRAGANAINDHGDIVGNSLSESFEDTATIWPRGGAPANLNDLVMHDDPLKPCASLLRAEDINERGEILVQGEDLCDGRINRVAYRLIPKKTSQ